MPTILDSLFVSLGFRVNPDGLEGFAEKTEQAKHMALGFAAAIAGAAYGIEHLVKGAAERMGGIQNFSEQMGVSAREVAALGKVADENESSLEAMEGGLRGLMSMAGQAAQGVGRGAMIFKRFGIAVKDSHGQVKPMDQLLGDVADKMQKLPSLAQKQALGARFGFDPATVLLLSQGRENLARLREEALKKNPFADRAYEEADQTDKLFRKAEASTIVLKNRLAVGLMPTVNELIRKFLAWTSNEKNIAKLSQAINKVVEVVGVLARNLDKILAVFAVIYAHKYGLMFIGWGQALVGVVAQLRNGAAVTALLKSGFIALQGVLTGGVLGLLILVGEDLWTFHKGGVSVTGWMLTQFPQAVDVMKQALVVLSAAFVALTTGSGAFGLVILGIGEIIILFRELQENGNVLSQWWDELWDGIFNKIADAYNSLPAPVRGFLQWIQDGKGFDTSEMGKDVFQKNSASRLKLGAGLKDYETWKGNDDETSPGWLKKGGPAFMRGSPLVVRSQTVYHATTNVGAIHVHGVSDPKKVAQAVRDELYKGNPHERDIARVRTRNAQSGAL
jgi:hypothetical protein